MASLHGSSQAPLPWALLVVGNPSLARAAAQARIDPPATVLRRALSLTSIAKTSCLIEDALRPQWSGVIQQLWPENVTSLKPDERVLEGVTRQLEITRAREPEATIILIPFNHCAVEELTWLDSAKGALRLGGGNRNTVYFLHDSPDNDPRDALEEPEVCTSSVLVGAAPALLGLCRGGRPMAVVDLVVDKPAEHEQAPFTDAIFADDPTLNAQPLNAVHVRLVEEYASLQRQDVWHRKTRGVDLHA